MPGDERWPSWTRDGRVVFSQRAPKGEWHLFAVNADSSGDPVRLSQEGAAEWQGLTGGWNGLSGIPGPSVFGTEIGERGIAYLTLALVVAIFAIAAMGWGVDSRDPMPDDHRR